MRKTISIDETIQTAYLKLSKPFKTAFVSACLWGIAAHLYMFMNKLPNYDDMGLNGFGATFRLGRWFLWVLGAAAYHLDFVYSLPWVNGMVTILFIALSAGLVADIFKVRSFVGNVLIGAAMVVYPSWTATFFFMFTAPYYAFALFLAVLSVYISLKGGLRCFVISSVLIVCSLGIYQAYLPFAATICVMMLLVMLIESKNDYIKIIRSSFYYLAQLAVGVIIYLLITKISLAVTGQELADYKGVNSMGSLSGFSFSEFIEIVCRDFIGLAYNNNLELSYNYVTKFMYAFLLILLGAFIILLIIRNIKGKQYLKAVETVVIAAAFVIAINSIYIVSGEVYSLMRYSYVCLMIFPICFVDRYKHSVLEQRNINHILRAEWVTSLVLLIGIMSYCHYANAQYLSMDLSIKQAESYYTTVITQIKSLEGYSPEMKTAFIGYGDIEDESLYRNQVMEVFEMSGRDSVTAEAYSIEYFLKYYCGFDTELVGADTDSEEIQEMPVYPQEGSIKIIDDVVVVKFAEEE